MTSGRDASRETLDKRLAEARDSILFDGEKVLAQEMGDQGQAVVLTQSRILIVKAGLAATGEMNGQKAAAYAFSDIESVKLRKGPMGAVIQVCPVNPEAPTPGSPPMNVVVFADSQKVKRAEALADQVETAMGKPVDRIEPGGAASKSAETPVEEQSTDEPQAQLESEPPAVVEESSVAETLPDPPVVDLDAELEQIEESEPAPRKGGREAKSLAEEMFGDMSEWTPPVAPAQPETPAPESVVDEVPVIGTEDNSWDDGWTKPDLQPEQAEDFGIEPIPQLQEDEAEPVVAQVDPEDTLADELSEPETALEQEPDEFRPNPNLPTPAKKKKKSTGTLVMVAILAVFVVAGTAVMAPLKKVDTAKPSVVVDVDALTRDAKLLQAELEQVTGYRVDVETLLAASSRSAAAIQAALRSGNTRAAMAAARDDASGKARTEIETLKTPTGLAAAQDDIISGLIIRKNASAAVTGSINTRDALRKFDEANKLISRGHSAIEAMQQDLERRISELNLEEDKK